MLLLGSGAKRARTPQASPPAHGISALNRRCSTASAGSSAPRTCAEQLACTSRERRSVLAPAAATAAPIAMEWTGNQAGASSSRPHDDRPSSSGGSSGGPATERSGGGATTPDRGRAADGGGADDSVPVYVMLPLDTIRVHHNADGTSHSCIQSDDSVHRWLVTLKEAGVRGVMVDVWWGICEREGPGRYDFHGYAALFDCVAAAGLKVQAVMSFHAAGSNVGDTCNIPLPPWVVSVGMRDPDIFYTDRGAVRNRECLSLAADREPVFWGHTPLDVYEGFMRAFADRFQHLFGTVISEITVGCGPAGEARYPAYPEGDRRWRFPGVGEFQCYDAYMRADLAAWAEACGNRDWGHGGPHDAGSYCSQPHETAFFHPEHGRWKSDYGEFFLAWYSDRLARHVHDMLAAAERVLVEPGRPRVAAAEQRGPGAAHKEVTYRSPVRLGIKLAGVHWCYACASHAAEATAGYFNTSGRDGYAPFFRAAARTGGVVSFTCVEMRDCEHPPESACSPERLLQQVIQTSQAHGVPLTGENALQRYDRHGLHRIRDNSSRSLHQLTFLRMGSLMIDHWDSFKSLVADLNRAGRA